MGKRNSKIVHLPHPCPYVELPEHLATPLKLIINAGGEGMSTLDLQAAGITGCASMISRLTKRGACFERELRDVVDSNGKVRKRICHYIYRGWTPTVVTTELKTTNSGGQV